MGYTKLTAMTLADEIGRWPGAFGRDVKPGRSKLEDGWDIVTRFS